MRKHSVWSRESRILVKDDLSRDWIFLLRMFLVNGLEKITEIQKVDYEKKPNIAPYAGMHF